MTREYRIFEVDKYENKWFVCRHSTLESAKYYLKTVLGITSENAETADFVIEDEAGVRHI